MEALLGKVTQQAVNYAIRSGVTLTASFALRQGTRLIKSSPKSSSRDEVARLQQQLEHKIRIVSPAIDMIELIAARGNTSLESAVTLTKDLRYEIQSIGQRLQQAAAKSEQHKLRGRSVSAVTIQQHEADLRAIAADIKQLLTRIEDAVPLINLAITTSGVTLSTQLPSTVSPSRLLQASTFLTAGDTQYSMTPHRAVQIGPTFVLTVYMLFAGHNRPQNEDEIRETTWKEVIHKARVKMRRVPLDVVLGTGTGAAALPSVEIAALDSPSHTQQDSTIPAESRADEYAYQIMIVEDLEDDRVHDFEEDGPQPAPFDDIQLAGIREMIPIHEISKIFYADTSKVLNISPESEVHHPVLLLKRDVNAVPPRRMAEREESDNDHYDDDDELVEGPKSADPNFGSQMNQNHNDPWRFPPSLDPEWIAFEVYTEAEDSDTESEGDLNDGPSTPAHSTSALTSTMSNLHVAPVSPGGRSPGELPQLLHSNLSASLTTAPPPPWANRIQTSLSLLELLLRLTSLQQFQQASHLSITDELLNFFLEESATTGAGGDETHRQAVRAEARRRVGWDPYDESPLKRRGEQYQYQYAGSEQGATGNYSPYDDGGYVRSPREGTPSRGTPAMPGTPGQTTYINNRASGDRGSWSSTRDISRVVGRDSTSPAPSPSPAAKNRTDFLRRQGQHTHEKQNSPLRQMQQGESRGGGESRAKGSQKDEGLGTSPASIGTGK